MSTADDFQALRLMCVLPRSCKATKGGGGGSGRGHNRTGPKLMSPQPACFRIYQTYSLQETLGPVGWETHWDKPCWLPTPVVKHPGMAGRSPVWCEMSANLRLGGAAAPDMRPEAPRTTWPLPLLTMAPMLPTVSRCCDAFGWPSLHLIST